MKDSELITFTNDNVGELRGFIKDGEPWFLAGQVCRCLGIKDASTAVKQVEERLKIADIKGTVSNRIPFITEGGKQTIIVINEQCLYELIFASRKQKAIKFRTWVTGEVLPSLRKYGEYRMTGKLIRRALTDKLDDSGESERMHGHAFTNYSIMINKSLGFPNRVNRDELDADMLEKIATRENTVAALVSEGRQFGEIKTIIENFGGAK